MNLARRVVESPPSVRWHLARLRTPVYRRSFRQFGDDTVIVRPLTLRGTDRISIGARCAVYEGVWLQAEEPTGSIEIGDEVYVGHDVHLHAMDLIRIGDRAMLADGVYIGSADHDRTVRSSVHGTGPVHIGENVFLGQRSIVLGGVSVGDGATVGGGAVVTRDVEPGTTVAGVPARVVGRSAP